MNTYIHQGFLREGTVKNVNFEKYWMVILFGNVLPKSFLLLCFFSLIKANKYDSRLCLLLLWD